MMLVYIVWFVVLSSIGMLACYRLGLWQARLVPEVDITRARFQVTEPAPAPIRGVVIPLPEISIVTASLDVITAPIVVREKEQAETELAEAKNVILALEEALNEQTKSALEKDRLRAKHYRSARRAQGRYRAVVSATFEASRRPTCERALALVTEIGTVRAPEHTKVITPQTHQRWLDIGLVAA